MKRLDRLSTLYRALHEAVRQLAPDSQSPEVNHALYHLEQSLEWLRMFFRDRLPGQGEVRLPEDEKRRIEVQ